MIKYFEKFNADLMYDNLDDHDDDVENVHDDEQTETETESLENVDRRFRRNAPAPAHSHVEETFSVNKSKKTKASDIECIVSYLDGTEQTFYLSKNAMGSELYDISFSYVGLVEEKDYFGLQFIEKIPLWLDPTKDIRKQCKASPYRFSLRVKFFASNPHNLHDEYCRYLIVTQLREDIHTGRLRCDDMQLAAELAALLLQAEFGDYDPKQHTPVFVSTFRFLPEDKQTEEFELSVIDKYKSISHRNMTPSNADSLYLGKVRLLPDYGIEKHIVKGKDNEEYSLGLTPSGILVYQGSQKIGLFLWHAISKLDFKRNKLKIVANDEDTENRRIVEHAYCFVLPDSRTCKDLWKRAIEHHTFFRLSDRPHETSKQNNFFRLGSRFHASFNTEYQLHRFNMFGTSSFRKRKKNVPGSETSSPSNIQPSSSVQIPKAGIGTGTTSSFRRVPSKRFAARPSFSKRSDLGERRARRDKLLQAREQNESNVPVNSAAENASSIKLSPESPVLRNNLLNQPKSSFPLPQISSKLPPNPAISSVKAPTKPPRRFDMFNRSSGSNKNSLASNECFEYAV